MRLLASLLPGCLVEKVGGWAGAGGPGGSGERSGWRHRLLSLFSRVEVLPTALHRVLTPWPPPSSLTLTLPPLFPSQKVSIDEAYVDISQAAAEAPSHAPHNMLTPPPPPNRRLLTRPTSTSARPPQRLFPAPRTNMLNPPAPLPSPKGLDRRGLRRHQPGGRRRAAAARGGGGGRRRRRAGGGGRGGGREEGAEGLCSRRPGAGVDPQPARLAECPPPRPHARQVAGTSCVEGGPLDPEAACDGPLIAGARIAARVRGQVLSRLGYTCSAGVAGARGWGRAKHAVGQAGRAASPCARSIKLNSNPGQTPVTRRAANKLLAKIGSARNKPNQQTVVAPRGVAELMRVRAARRTARGRLEGPGAASKAVTPPRGTRQHDQLPKPSLHQQNPPSSRCFPSKDMPLSKIKGLGGKLGTKLTEGLGASTAGEVAVAPWRDLVRLLDEERARWGRGGAVAGVKGWSSAGSPLLQPRFARSFLVRLRRARASPGGTPPLMLARPLASLPGGC
jgi:hypothetical protein